MIFKIAAYKFKGGGAKFEVYVTNNFYFILYQVDLHNPHNVLYNIGMQKLFPKSCYKIHTIYAKFELRRSKNKYVLDNKHKKAKQPLAYKRLGQPTNSPKFCE